MLDPYFKPTSIAVVGASQKNKLLATPFSGTLLMPGMMEGSIR